MNDVSNPDQSAKRRERFTELYKKAFPAVAKYISRTGGSFDEAKDIFHDALVVYYEKTAMSQLVLNNDIAYLVGTAKNLWLKRYHDNRQNIPLDNMDMAEDNDHESLSNSRLLRYLTKAGKKCMELLTSFYHGQMPLTEIAETFGYSGVRSATVQKYKCLEKVRETIKEKALTYDDFME